MPDYDITTDTVFPTVNDVAGSVGDGKKLRELKLSAWVKSIPSQNFVISGFALPASSANLNISVPSGAAWIGGYRIDVSGSTSVTATASQTNHVYLKIVRDGASKVTGAKFEVNTTGTPPTDSVKIGTLIAGVSTITSTTDYRPTYPLRRIPQSQVFSANGSFVVPAGITEIKVRIYGASGGSGGGGGGGGAGCPNPGGSGGDGGVGGFGGYCEAVVSVIPGAVYTCTIGAAGTAGGGGTGGATFANGTGGANGGAGGTTSFGAILSATGGSGGQGGGFGISGGASSTHRTSVGSPGVGSGGDVNLNGGGLPPGVPLGSGGGEGANGTNGTAGFAGRIVVEY